MKKGIVLLISFLLSMILVSCGSGKDSTKPTEKPAGVVTTEPGGENRVTPKATENTDVTATPKNVNYDNLGYPNEAATVVFFDDFEDTAVTNSSVFRFADAHEVTDGKLHLSWYNGQIADRAESYSPTAEYYYADGTQIKQLEFSFDVSSDGQSGYTRFMVGLRCYDYMGGDARPSDENSGLYVAFCASSDAVIYHGLTSQWPAGAVTVPVPKGFEEEQTVTVVDTGSNIFYYLSKDGGAYTLFLKVELSETIKIYDINNTMVYSAGNNLRDNEGGYFKLFNHFPHTRIDNMTIKELS